MSKRSGMYNSNKRKKELARKKKQDEKRMKRQKNSMESSADLDGTDSNADDSVSSDDLTEPTSN